MNTIVTYCASPKLTIFFKMRDISPGRAHYGFHQTNFHLDEQSYNGEKFVLKIHKICF